MNKGEFIVIVSDFPRATCERIIGECHTAESAFNLCVEHCFKDVIFSVDNVNGAFRDFIGSMSREELLKEDSKFLVAKFRAQVKALMQALLDKLWLGLHLEDEEEAIGEMNKRLDMLSVENSQLFGMKRVSVRKN